MMQNIDAYNEKIMAPIIEQAQSLADQHKQNKLPSIPIISITGSKGSGKSYFARHLQQILINHGCHVTMINQNGFVPYKEIDPHGLPIDPRFKWHELHTVLQKIIAGISPIDIPFRDKSTHPFTIAYKSIDFADTNLVIFDGTFALTDATTYNFMPYATFGVFIKTSDENLYRWRWQRHLRNQIELQKTPEQFNRDFMHNMETYQKYILPTEQYAQYIISKDAEHRYTLLKK